MRVLLVEDEAQTAKSIQLMLDSLSYDWDTVECGKESVDRAKRGHYDIILLDIMLPDMDGYDVLKQLQAEGIDTPVVIQSGLVDRDLAVQGVSLGVDDYLIKPYSQVELAVRIESALHRACMKTLSQSDIQEPREDLAVSEAENKEDRQAARRSVARSAKIIYPDLMRTMECVVLNLSDGGAAINPADPLYCPSSFTLKVFDGLTYRCAVCWRNRDKIGVRFLNS